jgi:hypothetical protein
VGIGFFGAIIKARDIAQVMGIGGHRWSAWAIASLLLPIVGAIIPWLVIGEIRRSIIYSARHSCFDDTWGTKSRFSIATLLVAISVFLNLAAIKVWADNGQRETSAEALASALSDMPLGLSLISGCFAVSLVYLFTARAYLSSLAHRYNDQAAERRA